MTNEELNAKCAEIMGFKYHLFYGWVDSMKRVYLVEWKHGYDEEIWNPCEDIAQAFEVAEKFCRMESITMRIDRRVDRKELWNVQFGVIADASNDSLALAITRACVAAWQNKEKV